MLRVTVMMLRLIVESVILLKDEDCERERKDQVKQKEYMHQPSHLFHISPGALLCLRGAHPVYFGHFVPPSAALVSPHQL